mmetsp:Transcript_2109/g.3724  ORF Transcript_2109/g.3724 Transcript_2109/m.3724 type:complete len:249 (-) Transcript_2109:41-787(-)
MMQRRQAWCVMLGINYHSEEFLNFKQMYEECIRNNSAQEDAKLEVMHQIKVDVYRTFRPFNLKFLNCDVGSGNNKLYNLLKVYALLIEPEIGYTQGMNFIAALVLMHVQEEALACKIFIELLNKDDWIRMYISSTPKLFDVCACIQERIKGELPLLHAHLFEHQIIMEVILAGPLFTLFASNVNFSEATHVLNMFILDGKGFVVDLILSILATMQDRIVELDDSFEIQSFMAREMIEAGIEKLRGPSE